MSQAKIKRGKGLIRSNVTPPGWEAMAPETRGRLVALVLARQGGRGDVVATPNRLYAQVACDADGFSLRQEVMALVAFGNTTCPGGCRVDLAIRGCECDKELEWFNLIPDGPPDDDSLF